MSGPTVAPPTTVGTELARRSTTQDNGGAGTINTTETVLTDLDSITVTTTDRPALIHYHCGWVTDATSGAQVTLKLRDITGLTNPTATQGTVVDQTAIHAGAANRGGPVDLWARQAAGTTKTYRVTMVTSTGNGTAWATGGIGQFLEAVAR